MEFLVMPQTVHSLVECYSASDGDNCTRCNLECTCYGEGSCYERGNTCTCKGVRVCGAKNSCIALCANKSCTVKAEIMNQP